MSHPDGLPDLFLDRSLGRKKVPELLRAQGIRLITLAEHYGIPDDETIADTEASRIIRALDDLEQVCVDRARPFLYALHQNRIEDIPLD